MTVSLIEKLDSKSKRFRGSTGESSNANWMAREAEEGG